LFVRPSLFDFKKEGREPLQLPAALSIQLRWREEEDYFFSRPKSTAPVLSSSIVAADGAADMPDGMPRTRLFAKPRKSQLRRFFID